MSTSEDDFSVDYNYDYSFNYYDSNYHDDIISESELLEKINQYLNATSQETFDNLDEEITFNPLFDFWIPGVFLMTVGIIGVLGQLLSLIMFIIKPKTSLSILLLFLSISDLLLITTSIFMFSLPALHTFTLITNRPAIFSNYFITSYPFITPILYPLAMISQTMSTYLTASLPVQRFFSTRSSMKPTAIKSFLLVLFIAAFSITFNVPRFFEVTHSSYFDSELQINITEIIPTPLRKNSLYVTIYTQWSSLIVGHIIPLFLILIFIVALVINNVRRVDGSFEERCLSFMVIFLAIIFIFCNSLSTILNIVDFEDRINSFLSQTSNFLITLNCSFKFIVYLSFFVCCGKQVSAEDVTLTQISIATPCHVTPSIARLCQDTPSHTMPCHATPSIASPCQDKPSNIKPCQDTPSSSTSCHVTPISTTTQQSHIQK